MNSADSCIRNYLNGNLLDAKRQAKRVKPIVIYQALTARFGKTSPQAVAITHYLKDPSPENWQAACDCEHAIPQNCPNS